MKDADKTQLIEELALLRQRVVEAAQDITECRRVEDALRHREAILEAVSVAAERFLKATAWEGSIQQVLEQLGWAADVSRVYIFENHVDDDGRLLTSQRYEWVAPGIAAQIDNPELQGFDWLAGSFGRWVETLGTGGVICGHVHEFPAGEREVLASQDIRSLVAVPIFVEGNWWGFMGFDACLVGREWSAAEIDALRAAVGILGAAVQRKRAEEALQKACDELETRVAQRTAELARANEELLTEIADRKRAEEEITHRNEELAALNKAGQAMVSTLDLDEVLALVMAEARTMLDVEVASVLLLDATSDELVFAAVAGPTSEILLGTRIPAKTGIAGWAVQQAQPALVLDAQTDPRFYDHIDSLTGMVTRSLLAVPLQHKKKTIGVIEVANKVDRSFNEHDLDLLTTLAGSAAIAIENARLYSDLQWQMERLKDTQAQLVQSAKLAAVGELAAGVAHELNNPLTSILMFAEILMEDFIPVDPHRKELETIAAEARRARDIVRNLLDFARQTRPRRQQADIHQILQQTLGVIRRHLEKSGVAIEENYAQDIDLLPLDVGKIKQVLLNLIANAAQAMPKGGILTVRTARIGNEVAVSISDTGGGIPPEVQERIFDPFFTTKPFGTGLGLSVSLGIVQEHGGHITVENLEGHGSTFTVWLPIG